MRVDKSANGGNVLDAGHASSKRKALGTGHVSSDGKALGANSAPSTDKIPDFHTQYNKLATSLIQDELQKDKCANVLVSPLSIYTILAILASASAGDTQEEILKSAFPYINCTEDDYDESFPFYDSALGHANTQKIEKFVSQLIKDLKAGDNFSWDNIIVNNDKDVEINDYFSQGFEQVYKGQICKSEDTIFDINEWVYQKTNGQIPRILQKNGSDFVTIILNAIAFEDKWQRPYEPANIELDTFTNADGKDVQVEMMSSKENLYIENKDFTGFVKPYKGDFSFVALLPKKEGSLNMLNALRRANIQDLVASARSADVNACIPKFEGDFSVELKDYLCEQGIKLAFTEEAEFDNLTLDWIMLDSVLHKTHIEVDAQGTKAAAATEAECLLLGMPDFDKEKFVILDRPFVYAIAHKKTGLPLFVGCINEI